MSDLGLESQLLFIKGIIYENPNSEAAKQEVESRLEAVLQQTGRFQTYSISEFLQLVQISILGVSYARKGITDLVLLQNLVQVVPNRLGIDVLFPVVEANGSRRLWYYSDVLDELPMLSKSGRGLSFRRVRKFGQYSLFVAGIFPETI